MSEKLAGVLHSLEPFGTLLALAISMPGASDPTHSMDERIEPVQVKVVVVTMFEIGADEVIEPANSNSERTPAAVYGLSIFGLSRLTF